MGRKKVEIKKQYSDYGYITLSFAPDGDDGRKVLAELAEVRPDRRTALLEKWHRTYKNVHPD